MPMSSLIMFRIWIASAVERRGQDQGASQVEYAMLMGLIAVVCLIAITQLGVAVDTSFGSSGSSLLVAN